MKVKLDRVRIYLVTTGEPATVKCLISTERSIDRIFSNYKRHMNIPRKKKVDWLSECIPFVGWMRQMKLCKVLEYGEFNLDKNGGDNGN